MGTFEQGFTCGCITCLGTIVVVLFINWIAEPTYKESLRISYKSTTSEVNKKLADEIIEKNFPNMKYDTRKYSENANGFSLMVGTKAR